MWNRAWVALTILSTIASSFSARADVNGPWRVEFTIPGGGSGDACRFTFSQSGADELAGKLTGCALGTDGIFTGTRDVSGNVELTIVAPDDPGCEIYTMSGTLAPDEQSIAGTFLCLTPLTLAGNFDATVCDPDVPGECPGSNPSMPLSLCYPHSTATGCKVSTTAKAGIKIERDSDLRYEAKLRIPRASATMPAELGDPTTTRDYVACLYHTVGGELTLFAAEPILAGRSCGSVPCWKSTTTGFKYRNGSTRGSQLRSMLVKSGAAGKAKVKAGGGLSTILAPPVGTDLGLPVVAQIVSGDTCWSATFLSADENAAGKLKAKGGQ
jgi:hypothetical protein